MDVSKHGGTAYEKELVTDSLDTSKHDKDITESTAALQ
jgi:hypothetical protein